MKNIKYCFLMFAIVAGFSNCKKELDQNPTATFTDANAFQTIDDIKSGVNGAYQSYGAYANDMYVNTLLSDEARMGSGNSGQGALAYRYQYGSNSTSGSEVTAAWTAYFGMIDQVNRVLPHIATVEALPSEEPMRNFYKAQLLGLRGIANFQLLQAYCKNYDPADTKGIPIMLQSDAAAKPRRNTMGEVMDQINSDLAEAKAGLPAVDPSTFSDTALNPINIAAYQARIALYRRDYTAAVAFATEVINSGVKPLTNGQDFADIWFDESNSEVLFRVMIAGTGIGSIWTTTGGNIYYGPSDKLVASYSPDDIRGLVYIGNNGSENYVQKFYISARGGRIVDIKAARTAEMYLIRAEAYAKQGAPDLIAGSADLNLLRSNRIQGYVDETFPTAQALIDAVIEERYKELAFEGFRFYDLKRNNLPVERAATDASPEWQTLAAGNYRFVLPIPSYEMDGNPNMVQNDGY